MDTFGFTILIIVVTTLAVSYIRRITKDKCIKSFEGYVVTIEMADGTKHLGKLEVENTGIEVIFKEQQIENDILKMSHIVFKDEYTVLNSILRYHDELTEKGKKRRKAALEKTYHPKFFRKLKRKIINFFKLIKDSLMEIATALSGRIKATEQSGTYAGNEKYATKLNQELVNTIDASYDPLLEKYIGNVVAVTIRLPDGIKMLSGILKEYTMNFVELLDVKYFDERQCDIVLPRRICHVRGLGESSKNYSIFSFDFDIKRYKKFFHKINVKKRNQK